MSIFTFHLAKTSAITALKALLNPPKASKINGLKHAECMSSMVLGAPIFSTKRMLLRQFVLFAQWEDEAAIDHFLENNSLGKTLAKGWHVRLKFLRQWGFIDEFDIPKECESINNPDKAVVAVTIARMRPLQIPRFISWGKPAEKLVRDHPGTIFSMAAMRLPNTVSTFSIWKNQQEMVDMVRGHSSVPQPKRHADAMKERNRKDFHFQFTTLRFQPLSEHGVWQGDSQFMPHLNVDHKR